MPYSLAYGGGQAEQYRFLPWQSFPDSWLGEWLAVLSCGSQLLGRGLFGGVMGSTCIIYNAITFD